MRKMFLVTGFLLLVISTYANAVDVLVLGGNRTQAEFPVLEEFTKVGGKDLKFTLTKDKTLPDLENYDILWIGQGEICENAYFLNAEAEENIKKFVENGGIVISIGQDSDGGRPCEVGWIPADLVGIERGGAETFEVTDAPEVAELFKNPNKVSQAHFDDAWTQPDPDIILLATINAGQDVGVGLLLYGKGAYVVTSLENETAGDVSINEPIMENLLNYAVSFLPSILFSVEPGGKLPLMWGTIKTKLQTRLGMR